MDVFTAHSVCVLLFEIASDGVGRVAVELIGGDVSQPWRDVLPILITLTCGRLLVALYVLNIHCTHQHNIHIIPVQ